MHGIQVKNCAPGTILSLHDGSEWKDTSHGNKNTPSFRPKAEANMKTDLAGITIIGRKPQYREERLQ